MGAVPSPILLPFEGLPDFWQVWMTVTLVVVIAVFLLRGLLLIHSRRWLDSLARLPQGDPSAFRWVFLVPALDEEVVIADSVRRLLAMPVDDLLVVVVDDGSTDRTGQILAGIDDPSLVVLTRVRPKARTGKGDVLNDAWRLLDDITRERGWGREEAIVTVVDADGRLDAASPALAAAHFADPSVGGLQLGVKIYNAGHPLTRLQDFEFGIFGALHQRARSSWGTACMGGNGQMTRLSALDSVAGPEGPWRPMLTEDQDLGIRILVAGWRSVHEPRAAVHQQGLRSLRRLLRQRIRWCQGNLECLSLVRSVIRSSLPGWARLELVAFLVAPMMEGVVAVATVAAILFVLTGAVDPIPSGDHLESGFLLAGLYLLGAGGVLMGFTSLASGRGVGAHMKGLLVANLYFPYTWIVWAVLAGALWRTARGRNRWSKTSRDRIDSGTGSPPAIGFFRGS